MLVALLGVVVVAGTQVVSARADEGGAYVPRALLSEAASHPHRQFRVIVQQREGNAADSLIAEVNDAHTSAKGNPPEILNQFSSINGGAVELTGGQLEALARDPRVAAVVPDRPVESTAAAISGGAYSNSQLWPATVQAPEIWAQAQKSAASGDNGDSPAIAVIDSGVDADVPALSGRVVAQVDLYSGDGPNRPGDGRGHGTFVAGIAAGADPTHTGVDPALKIVSADVLDDNGSGYTSDVIAACDWVRQHADQYDIRVVNLSLNGTQNSSFLFDPLNKAVERLWLDGIVVVAAAGNYGSAGAASGVHQSPANDPFILTVGASDINGTASPSDDFAAPWSAWGYTNDGFMKPELAAPGRAMVGPVPSYASLLALLPQRQVAAGYMWMSGTSFAAPVVSAAAAYVLSQHPNWTPDQVKGALMAAAAGPGALTNVRALGLGTVQPVTAANLSSPPNPNAGLDAFVKPDATGRPTFDAAAWKLAALADPSWNKAASASMSWASMSWASMSWASMSWASMSWASMSWASMSWASMSWASMSWASSNYLP
jgi:serine protease AprX